MADDRKTPPDPNSVLPLENAFNQLDMFTEKLDNLKKAYNETAKEVAELARVVSTPVPPMLIQKPPVDGSYAIHTPQKSERPGPNVEKYRPPVPRPTPKKERETMIPKKPSGRFYIQIPKGSTTEELRDARAKLSQLGRVVDSGVGTAARADAGWVEIAVRDSDISDLIAKLKNNDLQEYVEKVIEVEPGEGRLQARQLSLAETKKAAGS